MRRRFVTSGLVLLMTPIVGSLLWAHEGHEHSVMGKVVAIDDKRIEVLTTEGKRMTGTLSAETKYSRDKAPAERQDVKVGERVVLIVVEEPGRAQAVKRVLLGPRQMPDQQP